MLLRSWRVLPSALPRPLPLSLPQPPPFSSSRSFTRSTVRWFTWKSPLFQEDLRPGPIKLLKALEIGSVGQATPVQLTRSQILSYCGLVARDIRFIDDSSSYLKPKVLVRRKAIILGIEHVRAIVLNDRVLLFNYQGLWGRQLAALLQATLSGNDVYLDAPSSPVSLGPRHHHDHHDDHDDHDDHDSDHDDSAHSQQPFFSRITDGPGIFSSFSSSSPSSTNPPSHSPPPSTSSSSSSTPPPPQFTNATSGFAERVQAAHVADHEQSISYLERLYNSDVVDANSCFEFKVLEAVLVSVTVALDMQLHRLSAAVEGVLVDLTAKVNPASLQRLLLLKTGLAALELQAREVRNCLRGLIDDEDVMDAMYLSEPREETTVGEHDQVETLLVTYTSTLEQMCNEANRLLTTVRGSEEVMSITQDSMRNRIMTLNLLASGGAFAMSTGTMVTGIFGMNLDFPSPIANMNIAGLGPFEVMTGISICSVMACGILCFRYYYGHTVQLNLRGQTAINSFVTYADVVEDELVRMGLSGRQLDFAAFRMLLERVLGHKMAENEVRAMFQNHDDHQRGLVDANRFLTTLKIQKMAFRHVSSLPSTPKGPDFSVPET